MKHTAVIFDMDGVISDTQRLHTAAELSVLKELGMDYEHEAFARRFAGITDEEIFAQIFQENKINFSVEEAVSKKEKILYGNVDQITAMPGLLDLLKLLKQNGVKIGLASGSSKEYIRTVLEKLDIRNFFEVVVSADEVEAGKPSPDVFLRAAELLGVMPGKCVVIEDGRAGMKGAKAAGMKVVALVKDKSELWPADLIVVSLTELNINNLINWKGAVISRKKMLMLFLLIDGITLLIILAALWRTGVLRF